MQTSQSEVDQFTFTLPATRGVQGGSVVYMISMPMRNLARIVKRDDAGEVMDRSQREANKKRAQMIADYIGDAKDAGSAYIIPSLIGNVDQYVDFIPSELSDFVGVVKIPMAANIKLFDGQHRELGIELFIRNHADCSDTISLMLTENLTLDTRQQFFSDINNNASKPAAAISMAYNNKDPLTALAMHLAENVPGLSGNVDFEHNVVPVKSTKLISFKALYDATKKMLSLRGTAAPSESDRETAVLMWSAWSQLMRWEDMAADGAAREYRKEALGLHGVMINAIGTATAYMLKGSTPAEVADLIEQAAQHGSNIHYVESFAHAEWHGVCVDSQTGTVKADRRAIDASGLKLQAMITP
ncbi:DGQHR domain-containing protein [Escherichia coli]